MKAAEILITTTEKIPGKEYEIIGEVFGLSTQSKNMISDMGAGLKSIVGGEIRAYTRMSHTARDEAVERLRQEASDLDADVVVMMGGDFG